MKQLVIPKAAKDALIGEVLSKILFEQKAKIRLDDKQIERIASKALEIQPSLKQQVKYDQLAKEIHQNFRELYPPPTNGVDGINGARGDDGQNGVDGRNGIDGQHGRDGKDLILTNEIRNDFIDAVIKLIPTPEDGKDGKDGKNYKLSKKDRLDIAEKTKDLIKLPDYVLKSDYEQQMNGLVTALQTGKIKVPSKGGGGPTPKQTVAAVDSYLASTEWREGGTGVPEGGTTGQMLVKQSATDGDAEWETLAEANHSHANQSVLDATTASFLTTDKSKLDAIEASATADQTDSEIETAYNTQVDVVSQADAEAGIATTVKRWTAQRVSQAIAALANVLSLGETSSTAYRGDRGKTAYDHSQVAHAAADANNYTHPNHSGDVTSSADGAQTIANNAVTLAKMADIATASLLGRNTASTGDPEVLSAATARSLLNVADGAEANRTLDASPTNGNTTNSVSSDGVYDQLALKQDSISVGTTAPGSPSTNDLWIDTT